MQFFKKKIIHPIPDREYSTEASRPGPRSVIAVLGLFALILLVAFRHQLGLPGPV